MPSFRLGLRRWPATGCFLCAWALSSASALAAEGGQSEGIYFGDLGQAIVSLIIFFLLLAVLGKWAWKPLVKQLHHREESIAHSLEDAEKRQAEAQDLLAHYKARLDHAEADAESLLAKSRKESALLRQEMLDAARQEARQAVEQARGEINEAKQAALRELRNQTADLATDIAAEVLRKNITEDDQDRLMAASLAEMRRHTGEQPE